MGKSSLAMNIAIRVARGFKFRIDDEKEDREQKSSGVLMVCLEASDEQFSRRIIANIGSLYLNKLRMNKLSNHTEFESFQKAVHIADTLPIEIKDKGGLTLNELRYEIKRFVSKGGKLVIIDYIQLIRHKTKGGRTEDITEITNTLKAMALEFKIVIIGLSQLSRAVENREDKRPMLSDLRESGSLEQDADVVIFTFRPVYYLKDEKEKYENKNQLNIWQSEMERLKNVAYAIIAKVREGEPGDAKLHFVGEFQRFTEVI
jgi:replicative DNA helicase